MSVVVLADERPVSRKEHRCDVCGGVIASGEQYRRQRNIFDGEPYIWKAHGLCDAAMTVLWRSDPDAYIYDEGPDPEEALALVRDFWTWLIPSLSGRGPK